MTGRAISMGLPRRQPRARATAAVDDQPIRLYRRSCAARTGRANQRPSTSDERLERSGPSAEVGPGRGVGIAPGPFPRTSRPTSRACLDAIP